ncbi:hypothetical protein MMC12_000230 [Toensbergia leucococca]|nr:hypothetical protein [Toensbergia leucococca]
MTLFTLSSLAAFAIPVLANPVAQLGLPAPSLGAVIPSLPLPTSALLSSIGGAVPGIPTGGAASLPSVAVPSLPTSVIPSIPVGGSGLPIGINPLAPVIAGGLPTSGIVLPIPATSGLVPSLPIAGGGLPTSGLPSIPLTTGLPGVGAGLTIPNPTNLPSTGALTGSLPIPAAILKNLSSAIQILSLVTTLIQQVLGAVPSSANVGGVSAVAGGDAVSELLGVLGGIEKRDGEDVLAKFREAVQSLNELKEQQKEGKGE